MRVLIINPPWPGKGYGTRSQNRIIKRRGDKYLQYPLFLGYSAAQLKEAGHDVTYIDSVMDDLSPEATWARVERLQPRRHAGRANDSRRDLLQPGVLPVRPG